MQRFVRLKSRENIKYLCKFLTKCTNFVIKISYLVQSTGLKSAKHKDAIDVEPIELTEGVVQQYVVLEKDIHKLVKTFYPQ